MIAINNNLINTISFYYFLENRSAKGDTVFAEYNYWGTIDETTIINKIIDQEDAPPGVRDRGYVKYWPFTSTQIDKVGIH